MILVIQTEFWRKLSYLGDGHFSLFVNKIFIQEY